MTGTAPGLTSKYTTAFLMVPTLENKSGCNSMICHFTSSLFSLVLIGTGSKTSWSCCIYFKQLQLEIHYQSSWLLVFYDPCTDTCHHDVQKSTVNQCIVVTPRSSCHH